MENDEENPSRLASARQIRTHAEWNVDTHIAFARGPTNAETRSFISPAALLVNVMARIAPGDAARSAISQAIRWVSTRVLPEPAPATMSSGPPWCRTATRCCGLSPSRSVSGSTASLGCVDRAAAPRGRSRGSATESGRSSERLVIVTTRLCRGAPTRRGFGVDLFSLAGKTAVVTGGTRGIGLMIARGLLEAGTRKVYISARQAEACATAEKELSAYGDVTAIPADLSREAECRRLADEVGAAENDLNILVNNAGATWGT